MKWRRGEIAGIALLALAVAALLVWRLSPRPAVDAEAPVPQADAEGVLRLAPSQIEGLGIASEPVAAAQTVPLPGLAAQTQAPLDASAVVVSPWAGVVVALFVDEGDAVSAGQPLLRLRSLDAAQAQAELARARSEAEAARRRAERDAALLAEGIIAAARHEQSQAQARAAAAELARAQGALAGLRIAADAAPGDIDLVAPFAGWISRRSVAPGQPLAAQQDALLVADPARLDLAVGVPLTYRDQLRRGLSLTLPDGGRATLAAIGADSDPASQRLRIRARFDEAGGHVAGERFEVVLHLPAPPGALALPRAALLPQGEGHVAFRRDGERFRAVPIQRLLGTDGDTAVVLAARLEPGAEVATRGTAALKALIPAVAQ